MVKKKSADHNYYNEKGKIEYWINAIYYNNP